MARHSSPHSRNGSTSRKTMKATFWNGKPFHMEVKEVAIPTLKEDTDAIVRLTTSAICGTDLHIYHGVLGSNNVPYPVGHEGVGIVTEIGPGVTTVKVGDRVVIPDLPDDGRANPNSLDVELSLFGTGDEFGNLGGLQAEYARVPSADHSLLVIPNNPRDDLDFVLLSDIFPTAWGGLSQSGFQPGDTVVVFGAGPVGLLVAYSAILRGAAKVYSIDHVQARLDKADSIGAIPINLTHKTKGSKSADGPAAQILAREPLGVNRVIDAIGFECVNTKLVPEADFVLREAVKLCGAGGGIYLLGVYVGGPPNRGQPRADAIPDDISFNVGTAWIKNISIHMGGIFPAEWIPEILPLMASGKAKPSFVFSGEIGINEVPDGYRRFDEHKETKLAIRFPWEFDERVETSLTAQKTGNKRRAVDDADEEDESAQHNGTTDGHLTGKGDNLHAWQHGHKRLRRGGHGWARRL